MKKLALILALLATNASAQTYPLTEVHVSGLTHHFQDRKNGKEWNEQAIQGFGIRHAFSDTVSMQVDVAKDSMYRASTYASADYTPIGTQNVRLGGFAGVRAHRDGLQAQGGAIVRYQAESWSIAFKAWPTIGNSSGGRVIQVGRVF